jgi:hypothetical protein
MTVGPRPPGPWPGSDTLGGVMWSTLLVKRRAVDLCRVGSCLCSV